MHKRQGENLTPNLAISIEVRSELMRRFGDAWDDADGNAQKQEVVLFPECSVSSRTVFWSQRRRDSPHGSGGNPTSIRRKREARLATFHGNLDWEIQ